MVSETHESNTEMSMLKEKDAQIERLQRALFACEATNQDLTKRAKDVSDMLNSNSWRITAPFRAIVAVLKKMISGTEPENGFAQNSNSEWQFCRFISAKKMDIYCDNQNVEIAKRMQRLLQSANIPANISCEQADEVPDGPSIIFNPDPKKKIPDCCVIVNTETGPDDLKMSGWVYKSYAVLETREENLSFYDQHQELSRKAYYLPLGSEFPFFFLRFLFANDLINFETFYESTKDCCELSGDRICLSMPESVTRRNGFLGNGDCGFSFFPGVRHRCGWIGCARSYQYIARKALELGKQQLTVCEDDAILPGDFSEKIATVNDYLSGKDWDVFSGIMSDIGEVEITKEEKYGGLLFVWINRMVSTVFDVFGEKALRLISNWNPEDEKYWSLTIDRYLESRDMKVVTNVPFLVEHDEGVNSTLWGGTNSQYREMIAKSKQKMKKNSRNYLHNVKPRTR